MPIACRRLFASCLITTAAACGSAIPSEELTLENCTTSIASDVPEFYKRHFKCVTITMSGTDVVIASNGLPPHRSAYYVEGHPNHVAFDTSRGATYMQNPNEIEEQAMTLTIPAEPKAKGIIAGPGIVDKQANTNADEYRLGLAGLALDGVALFNSTAAPGDDIEDEQFTFDSYSAHPENSGMYHYHSTTPGPLEVLTKLGLATKTTPGEAELEIYGIMCDGTVVLGCTEADGSAPTSDDFDAQNGHLHDVKGKDGTVYFTNRYHTHICPAKFPKFSFTPEIQYYQACGSSS